MKTWVRKSLNVGVLSAGMLLAAGPAAQAATLTSMGNFGIGNGTQALAPVTTVADVCGNTIAAAGGVGYANCVGGASANVGEDMVAHTMGNFGIANGTQAIAPVTTVADLCGNAIPAAAAVAAASCVGGAAANVGSDESAGYYSSTESAQTEGGTYAPSWSQASTTLTSMGNFGILNGTQVYAPITTVIDLCGNSIPLAGAVGFAACQGGADANVGNAEDGTAGGTTLATAGNFGIGNGTQAYAPVTTVLNVCGNAIPAIGAVAAAFCQGGAQATEGTSDDCAPTEGSTLLTAGNFGIGNGTQAFAPVTTVADISGNAIPAAAAVAYAQSVGGALANLG